MRPWCEISSECEGESPTSSTRVTGKRSHPRSPKWKPGDPWWAVYPHRTVVNGTLIETYPVSSMAAVLGRTSATVRRWETVGILPRPPIIELGASWQGDRRRYQREHIEAAERIGAEENVVGVKVADFASCRFTARMRQAYAILADR